MSINNNLLQRLRALDLNSFVRANGDMTVSEAITALQQAQGLSFACPQCMVDDNPTGVITISLGNTGLPMAIIVCPLCAGYMATGVKYNSDGGKPPTYITNDQPQPAPSLAATATIADRLRPFDLYNFISVNGDMAMSAAVDLMAGTSGEHACPKCLNGGDYPTGIISDGNVQAPCDLCGGNLHTDVPYIPDPDNPRQYVPDMEGDVPAA